MQIPTYRRQTSTPIFRRPPSTAKQEGLLFKAGLHQQQAREYQHQAGAKSFQAGMESSKTGTINFIGGLVSSAIDVGKIIHEGRVNDEFTTSITSAETALSDLKFQYKKDTDYATAVERYGDDAFEIKHKVLEEMDTEEGKKQFSIWFARALLRYKEDVQGQAAGLEAQHARYNVDKNLVMAVELENKTLIDTILSGALSTGHIFQHEYQKMKDESYHAVDMRKTCRIAISLINPEGTEQSIKYLHSDKIPKDLTLSDIGMLKKIVNTEWTMIQADQAKDLEAKRTQAQAEIVQKYATGDAKELRELRNQVLQLDILPPTGTYSQLWWIDKIDTQIETYLEASSKGETDPNTQFNPEIYAEALQKIYDDNIDLAEKEEFILSNMGADAQGNARLRAREDIPTLLKLARGEKSFTVKTAFKAFDLALVNEVITPQQFIDITTDFNDAVESGKYTEQGLKDYAEIALAKVNDEWIESKLEKTGGFFSRKEKPEEYIERKTPEERPVEGEKPVEKSVSENYQEYFDKPPVSTHKYEDGREAVYDGKDWFMLINGVWHKVNKRGVWKPVKRPR